MIDIGFNFYTDATGPDPDNSSPTLRNYHQYFWSKELPNDKVMELKKGSKFYLSVEVN